MVYINLSTVQALNVFDFQPFKGIMMEILYKSSGLFPFSKTFVHSSLKQLAPSWFEGGRTLKSQFFPFIVHIGCL